MKMQLIGASLDDFSDFLFFINDQNELLFVAYGKLGVKIEGWGDISWSTTKNNSINYTCSDHNLNECNMFIQYDQHLDSLSISVEEERDGYDPEEDLMFCFQQFEPGEIVTHIAMEDYNVTEVSKKVLSVHDNMNLFEEKTVKMIMRWCQEYNSHI